MPSFAEALHVLNDMKRSGVLEDYAVAEAMAMVFWAEPIPTYDLDVLVFLPGDEATIVSLAPLYKWAAEHGYTAEAEHVMIEGVPVQFLPAHNNRAHGPSNAGNGPRPSWSPARSIGQRSMTCSASSTWSPET